MWSTSIRNWSMKWLDATVFFTKKKYDKNCLMAKTTFLKAINYNAEKVHELYITILTIRKGWFVVRRTLFSVRVCATSSF